MDVRILTVDSSVAFGILIGPNKEQHVSGTFQPIPIYILGRQITFIPIGEMVDDAGIEIVLAESEDWSDDGGDELLDTGICE